MNERSEFQETLQNIWSWIFPIVIGVVLVMVVKTFFFSSHVVDGVSMNPTLANNERIIVNRISYSFNEPQRGDIVIFKANKNENYIKRIIGLPGDTLEMRNDVLYVNNKSVEEPYLYELHLMLKKDNENAVLTGDFGPLEIPANRVFVMGDNRLNSLDSRYELGPISIERIIGRADLVYFPFGKFRNLKNQ